MFSDQQFTSYSVRIAAAMHMIIEINFGDSYDNERLNLHRYIMSNIIYSSEKSMYRLLMAHGHQ